MRTGHAPPDPRAAGQPRAGTAKDRPPRAEGKAGFRAGQEGNWRKPQKRFRSSKRERRENWGVGFDSGVKAKLETES